GGEARASGANARADSESPAWSVRLVRQGQDEAQGAQQSRGTLPCHPAAAQHSERRLSQPARLPRTPAAARFEQVPETRPEDAGS
ncbi:MAG: hypothetical protein MHM6MM_009515, partial [Cercozoa sp. M6MM]